ncbi:hypothetical protein D3C76_1870990 [compost metagenome]
MYSVPITKKAYDPSRYFPTPAERKLTQVARVPLAGQYLLPAAVQQAELLRSPYFAAGIYFV